MLVSISDNVQMSWKRERKNSILEESDVGCQREKTAYEGIASEKRYVKWSNLNEPVEDENLRKSGKK